MSLGDGVEVSGGSLEGGGEGDVVVGVGDGLGDGDGDGDGLGDGDVVLGVGVGDGLGEVVLGVGDGDGAADFVAHGEACELPVGGPTVTPAPLSGSGPPDIAGGPAEGDDTPADSVGVGSITGMLGVGLGWAMAGLLPPLAQWDEVKAGIMMRLCALLGLLGMFADAARWLLLAAVLDRPVPYPLPLPGALVPPLGGLLIAVCVTAWRSLGMASVIATTMTSAPAAASAGRSQACAEPRRTCGPRPAERSRGRCGRRLEWPVMMATIPVASTRTATTAWRGM